MTPPSEPVGAPAQTGPFLYTFTFRLPYVLGIRSGFEVTIHAAPYASAHDVDTFARPAFVRLRFQNQHIADHKFLPANLAAALATFYAGDVNDLEAGKGIQLYEQWVSMETPAVLLVDENPADGAYAFHRGLRFLNLFLVCCQVEALIFPG